MTRRFVLRRLKGCLVQKSRRFVPEETACRDAQRLCVTLYRRRIRLEDPRSEFRTPFSSEDRSTFSETG